MFRQLWYKNSYPDKRIHSFLFLLTRFFRTFAMGMMIP